MKKQFLLILTIVFAYFFSSCSKSNSSPSAYFKVKINGNWVTYTIVASELAPDLGDPSKIDLDVTSNNKDGSEIFSFGIQGDHQLTTGTYLSDDPNYFIDMIYMKSTNTDLLDYGINDVSNRPPSKYTISISSITDKEIRGTFTGNYLSDFSTEEVQEVTEGEFVAPRVQ